MAYKNSVLESLPIDKTVAITDAKKYVDYKDSLSSLSQDSGFNESSKSFIPDCGESRSEFFEKRTLTQDYENSENIDPTLLSPIKNERSWTPLTGTKEKKQNGSIFETPRLVKKDFSLRRRLLLSKATSGGNVDFDASECSAEIYGNKNSLLMPNFNVSLSNSLDDSPRDITYTPIATSTLKNVEPGTSSKKWRLAFAQQRTSTLDDSKCNSDIFPEVENISPVRNCAEDVTEDSILSINEYISQVPGTPICNLNAHSEEEFQTPVSNLAANFNFNLCTPKLKLMNDLDISITEDSAFHSLSLDKSQDSITDHEGSFQELIPNSRETPKAIHTKSRLRKLDRCRRLSTLRERGSQSEVEEEPPLLSLSYKAKVARESVDEENEDMDSANALLKIEDLTGTPALRVVREMLMRSTRKLAQKATVQDILGHNDGSEAPEDLLSKLIGRKMGLEKLDILAELNSRNLRHILAFIFEVLNVESICSIWKVSKEWRALVVQDKIAHQRRKTFLRTQRAVVEQGRLLSSEDASTRLSLLNRSALKSVQTQARTAFQTPNSFKCCGTPRDTNSVLQSASKQQEYVKVAKTLFVDEALKPCPRCQFPAKYERLMKRGRCSRKDCGFDFCILCLCTFHGSEECNIGSIKRKNRKDALPGSAQSKRNLKRL
ncbi:F-box only protein 43 isoform 1-T2 [Discoglossus pictus]